MNYYQHIRTTYNLLNDKKETPPTVEELDKAIKVLEDKKEEISKPKLDDRTKTILEHAESKGIEVIKREPGHVSKRYGMYKDVETDPYDQDYPSTYGSAYRFYDVVESNGGDSVISRDTLLSYNFEYLVGKRDSGYDYTLYIIL